MYNNKFQVMRWLRDTIIGANVSDEVLVPARMLMDIHHILMSEFAELADE